jgi:hypothetical protein
LVVFLREKTSYHHYMMTLPSRDTSPFDSPATYQISVEGQIDPIWFYRLEGMLIYQTRVKGACSPVTTLEGKLEDQAALAGVLNTLYELHLPILLVKRLEKRSLD